MPVSPVTDFALTLGLSFFFGLAFEEFYARGGESRPGGIRTFPLLALTGGALYRLDTARLLPLVAGLVVLGSLARRLLSRPPPHGGLRPARRLPS